MWRITGYKQAVNPRLSFKHIYTNLWIDRSKTRPVFTLQRPTRLPVPSPDRSAEHYPRRRSFSMSNDSRNQDSTTTTDMDEIFKQKRILRSRVRKALRSMDPSLRSQEDNGIQNLVLEAPWFKSSQRLCAYISCSALREVDTSRLLSEILRNPSKDGSTQIAKKLYVPRVEDKNRNMRMLNISCMDDLIANSMNILEPAPVDRDGNLREDVMQANDPVDLFILPGLAFDRTGRRLGRGGGYYDTLLGKYKCLAKERNWRQPLLVALSYSLQIMDDGVLAVTVDDVPVDALVTPSGVILISQAALERMQI